MTDSTPATAATPEEIQRLLDHLDHACECPWAGDVARVLRTLAPEVTDG